MKLLHIKSSRNVLGLALDDMCAEFKKWLPNHNLPVLYDAWTKLLRSLGLKFVKIHVCPNDCMLYYKEIECYTVCTSCGLS